MRTLFHFIFRWLRGLFGYYSNTFVLDELIFAVTSKCNFRCSTCFYANTMDKLATNDAKDLSLDEIRQISSSIGTFKNLLISGGEPFLREDLPEICEIFYRHNTIGHIHLPSNGFYSERIVNITGEILKKCPHIHLTIGLSLDGLRTTHDAIKKVQGSFDRVIETVKALADLKKKYENIELYIITVVTRSNMGEIIRLSEFVKNSLPVDGHGPSPVRGIPYDKTVNPPLYNEWDDLAKRLMPFHRYWEKKKRRIKYTWFLSVNKTRYLYRLYARVLQGKKWPFRCQAGNSIGVLEPNGDVKLCELNGTIGNVRSVNYDFRKIWFSKEAIHQREINRQCSCTHACFLNPSISMSLPATIKSSFYFTMTNRCKSL